MRKGVYRCFTSLLLLMKEGGKTFQYEVTQDWKPIIEGRIKNSNYVVVELANPAFWNR